MTYEQTEECEVEGGTIKVGDTVLCKPTHKRKFKGKVHHIDVDVVGAVLQVTVIRQDKVEWRTFKPECLSTLGRTRLR